MVLVAGGLLGRCLRLFALLFRGRRRLLGGQQGLGDVEGIQIDADARRGAYEELRQRYEGRVVVPVEPQNGKPVPAAFAPVPGAAR